MKQATSLQKFRVPMLLPGITVTTQPDRLLPDPGRTGMARFKGQSWELFGEILSAESA